MFWVGKYGSLGLPTNFSVEVKQIRY